MLVLTDVNNIKISYQPFQKQPVKQPDLKLGGGRRGCREGDEGVGGNLGVIVVRACEPVFQNLPHSYTWPLKKRTHSYTRSSEMLTYSYTVL